MTSDTLSLVERLKSSAKAFRDHPIFTADGDPVRLTVQAEELDEAASRIEHLEASTELRYVAHLESQASLYRKALEEIARGLAPPEKEGHYLAHRQAVKVARQALSLTAGGEEDRASREPSHTHNAAMRPQAVCTGQGGET